MVVEPASRLFSSISLSADDGRWITSPAAIWFTTCWLSATMLGVFMEMGFSRLIVARGWSFSLSTVFQVWNDFVLAYVVG